MKLLLQIFAPFITSLILLAGPGTADPEYFIGRVVGVADGDTITVLHSEYLERIRLAGIDCPEKAQAFGTRAKQLTAALAFGKEVRILTQGIDRYGRTIGEVILPDGSSLNRELVRSGLAWWYRRYSNDVGLAGLEEQARIAHAGLWADPDPIPPWEFRHMLRTRK